MDNVASVIDIFQSVHQSNEVLLKTASIIKIVKKILQSRKKFLDIFIQSAAQFTEGLRVQA